MNLINDYFLLYHGKQHSPKILSQLYHNNDNFVYEIATLLLSCHEDNFTQYSVLEPFKEGVLKLSHVELTHIEELYDLQYSVISYMKETQKEEGIVVMHKGLDRLQTEAIISASEYEKLLSLFDPKLFSSFEKEVPPLDEKQMNYIDAKEALRATLSEVGTLFNDETLNKKLDAIENYLEKQTFSIGVTGVMNAGKSTFLNALIGEEVLGSSMVPETANLSVLKYAEKSYAKVFYWSEDEWEKIEKTAEAFDAIQAFVSETKKSFKEEFSSYIQTPQRVDEVEVDRLSHYTSARHKHSNLIKEIELGINLEFLSEGIEIVDTPGLDDVVIQREEITKMYLGQCDMMIHLMNVSQSATQKDISFIIDALMYQNVGKLLVILSRADSVSSSELDEVISYTKESIEQELKRLNADAKINFILEGLEFIAVSSKMALYHRAHRESEALEAGYTLEKTGIVEVEAYLYENLYALGNQRNALIINSAQYRLRELIGQKHKSLEFELRLLAKNEGDLEKELESFGLQKQKNKNAIKQMRSEVEAYKQESLLYVENLEKFLDAQLYDMKQRLHGRLLDDFSYALEKKDKNRFLQSLPSAIELALKDALTELVRAYRYQFSLHTEEVLKKIERQYAAYDFQIQTLQEEASAKDMLHQHFKAGLMHSSSAYLSAQLSKLFKRYKKADDTALNTELEALLSESFSQLLEEVKAKSEAISAALIEEFFDVLAQPIKMFEDKLENEEKLLADALIHFENDEDARHKKVMQIHQELKALTQIAKRCR